MLVPHSPVAPADAYDAARVLLGCQQRGSYVAWRRERWYSDEDLVRIVERERRDARYRNREIWLMRVHEDDVFTATTSHEILIATVAMEPMAVISSLDQLGVHHADSPTEDFAFAFDLLDRPALFDPIREVGIPLSEARLAAKRLGETRLRLMWQAGMTAGEVVDALYAPDLPDLSMLRMMAALRSPATKDVG